MKEFRNTLVREINRFGGHRIIPLITVVFPIALAIIFAIMFSEKVVSSIPIAVCDESMTTTSRQLVNMLNSRSSIYIKIQTGSVTEARKMMRQKKVAAVIYIPNNFESNILGLSSASVRAEIDGCYISRAGIAYKDIMTVFQALNIGVETKLLSSQGIPSSKAYELAYPIVLDQHILFNPYSSYAYFLLPGLFPLILVVAVIFSTLYAVGSEFRYGTAAEWLKIAGGNISIALAGKLLVYFIIFQIEAIFFNTIIFRYLGIGINFTELVLIELGTILLIVSYMSIAIAFIAIFQSLRFALSVGTLYGVAAFSFSGLAFPTVAMPFVIQIIGYFFPYFYYMQLFIEQGMRNNPNYSLALFDIGMFIVFTVIMSLSIPLLKKHCTDPKTYGKL